MRMRDEDPTGFGIAVAAWCFCGTLVVVGFPALVLSLLQ